MQINIEDYDVASKTYSENRVAVGLDVILGICTRHKIDIEKSELVDLGCGAGQYTSILSDFFHKVHSIDKSKGQLKEARLLVKSNGSSNVIFHQNDIRNTPLKSNSADVILISLVLHHLRDKGGNHYIEQKKALLEAVRILKRGGVLIIVTCSELQIDKGAWYCEVMPKKIINMRKSFYPNINDIIHDLGESGLDFLGSFIETSSRLHGSNYSDTSKIFDHNWRKVDSIFSSLDTNETNSFLSKVKTLQDNGKLKSIFEDNKKTLNSIGQATFLGFKLNI